MLSALRSVVATSRPRFAVGIVRSNSHQAKPSTPPFENLPVDWNFYRSLFGQPVISTYEALRTVGYDAPFEIFIKYCDSTGLKHKRAMRHLGPDRTPEYFDRLKKYQRADEGAYLMACWEAYKTRRAAQKAGETVDGEQADAIPHSSEEGPVFTGGSWKDWIQLVRPDAPVLIKKKVKRFMPPESPDWGLMTLASPMAKDNPRLWKTFTRDSEKRVQFIVNRAIRGPTFPSASIGEGRLAVSVKDWPVGIPQTYGVCFDKETQTLRVVDQDMRDLSPRRPLYDLIGTATMAKWVTLAQLEGLVDEEHLMEATAMRKLESAFDSFDLSTHIANKASIPCTRISTRPADPRPNGRWTFRVATDTSPGLPTAAEDALAAEIEASSESDTTGETGLNQDVEPDVDDVAATAGPPLKNTVLILMTLVESQLSSLDPAVSREHNPLLRIIPYITISGAYKSKAPGSWTVDVTTLNRNADPPTQASSGEALLASKYKRPPRGEAVFKKSASPETLRLWSVDHGEDLLADRRSERGMAAYTGEQVRRKFPLLWKLAKAQGHWKEIPDVAETALETEPEGVLESLASDMINLSVDTTLRL